MRKFMVVLLFASLLATPAVVAQAVTESRHASELVVTSRLDVPHRGGYVLYDSGEKLYINPACKQQLAVAGHDPRVIGSFSEIKDRPNVPSAEADTCDVISDQLSNPRSTEGADTASGVVLYVTAGTRDPAKGGFVVSDDTVWTRVTPDCKASLIDAGIPSVSSTWQEVSSFDRNQDITCDDILDRLASPPPPGETPGETPGDTPDETPHHGTGGWVTTDDETATYTDPREPTRYYFFDPDDHEDETWGPSRIGWLVDCDSVLFAQVDPIVAPGAEKSAHLHEFFGNPNVTPHTTTQSLADTPMTDIACSDRNDKSAYWSPVAIQDGRQLQAITFKAYYKSTTPETVPMPLGLRMVAGDAHAPANQDSLVGWWEQQRTNDLTPKDELKNTRGQNTMIVRDDDTVALVLRINFPNCWDGVHLDSPDHQSHVAYFDEASLSCPATHPVKIPQLVTFTQYDAAGGDSFELASGPWYTFHQDFWNAWSPGQMQELNERCILAELNCRVRPSRALEKRGQTEGWVPAA